MRFAYFATAFTASAMAAPFASPETIYTIEERDVPAMTNVLADFRWAMYNMDHQVVDAVSKHNQTEGTTVETLLDGMRASLNNLETELLTNADLDKVTKTLTNYEEMWAVIEKTVTEMINHTFGDSKADEIQQYLYKMSTANAQVKAIVEDYTGAGEAKRDVDAGGLLGLVNGLLNTVTGLLGKVEKLLAEIIKQISPSLAAMLCNDLKQVNDVVKKVRKVLNGTLQGVDRGGLLKEVHAAVSSLTTTVTNIVEEVDPSVGKKLNTLLKKVLKTVGKLEKQIKL